MIIDDSGVDLDVADVSGSIRATADLNTVLLNATVTDSSPERSLQIATALSTEFGVMVNQLDDNGADAGADVTLNVVSGPTLNPVPVSPKKTLNLGLGFLGGLALGLAAAILRELLDNTIRTPADAPHPVRHPGPRGHRDRPSARKSPLIVDSHARSHPGRGVPPAADQPAVHRRRPASRRAGRDLLDRRRGQVHDRGQPRRRVLRFGPAGAAHRGRPAPAPSGRLPRASRARSG